MAAWFGRKKIGIGWSPASWQGWLTLAVYVVVVIAIGRFFPVHTAPGSYYAAVGLATLALLVVAVATSRPSRRP